MKWIMLLIIGLIVLPTVIALHNVQPGTECRTRSDCLNILRTTKVQCAYGYSINREPACSGGKCVLCKPAAEHPTVDCRFDDECVKKTTCLYGKTAQCSGSKCVCAMPRPECKKDRDCVRPRFLQQQYQRMVCVRGACVTPPPIVTMLPRYWTQPRYAN